MKQKTKNKNHIEYLIYSKDNSTSWILISDCEEISLKDIFAKSITITSNFKENKNYENNISCTRYFNVIY